MHETYEYRRLWIKPRTWPSVSRHLTTIGADTVQRHGGSLYGLWTGQIGMGSNEGVVMTAWPDAQAAAHAAGVVQGTDEALESCGERLMATVRPSSLLPPSRPGIYAHRWFEFMAHDGPTFLDLLAQACQSMESAYEMESFGLWQSLDVAAPQGRVLLMPWYASLAMWERSRGAHAQTPEIFEPLHALTTSTIVATTVLTTTARTSTPVT